MLHFYSTLQGKKIPFTPLFSDKVSLYVCGPTVYDRIHLGNARSLVVFDLLYRILSHVYPKVIYVRNITDVDDKINAAAHAKGISIGQLTEKTIEYFHQDTHALNILPPTHEPKATDHIAHMRDMIQRLIQMNIAYIANDHVLFSVRACPIYGQLSQMTSDQMRAGERVEIAPYKKDPLDFVLWKPSNDKEPAWPSPWGYGRPGWHIECSAMSAHYLGPIFDIHGGGCDLRFPHHENERAQSCMSLEQTECARYWLHNGMLMVNGKKMAKSLGNFIMLHQAMQTHRPEVIRWALLSTHYRQTLDWTDQLLHQAECALNGIYRALYPCKIHENESDALPHVLNHPVHLPFLKALFDDMNTPQALCVLQDLARQLLHEPNNLNMARSLKASANLLGLCQHTPDQWLHKEGTISAPCIEQLIQERALARSEKNFHKADGIRDYLLAHRVILKDDADGKTSWHFQ
jgi:cysteinyl-tRNA synthetase